jgi:hypothetical protein
MGINDVDIVTSPGDECGTDHGTDGLARTMKDVLTRAPDAVPPNGAEAHCYRSIAKHVTFGLMTDLMEKALADISRWPAARQDEAAELLLVLDRLGDTYAASADGLAAIDEGLAQAERGVFATDAEIEAAFARFRR